MEERILRILAMKLQTSRYSVFIYFEQSYRRLLDVILKYFQRINLLRFVFLQNNLFRSRYSWNVFSFVRFTIFRRRIVEFCPEQTVKNWIFWSKKKENKLCICFLIAHGQNDEFLETWKIFYTTEQLRFCMWMNKMRFNTIDSFYR